MSKAERGQAGDRPAPAGRSQDPHRVRPPASGRWLPLVDPVRPETVVSTKRSRRDKVTRRTLLVVDLLSIELALVVAGVLAGVRPAPFDLALYGLAMLPVWALLFKLYGLYDRDIKRISHTGIDDLPWVFHSLVVGTLLLWAYMRLIPESQMLLEEVAWFGAFALPLMIAGRSLSRR